MNLKLKWMNLQNYHNLYNAYKRNNFLKYNIYN